MTQPVLDKQSKEYLDFCYKEYVRLAAIQETHLHSAFSDIKLLSAVGAMLAWKPITGAFVERDDLILLTLGFVALLVVTLLIFLFDFIRQSIMLFYTDQLKHYEAELRDKLDIRDGTMFSSISNWTSWMQRFHEPIVSCFFTCFFGFIILFPTLVILGAGTWQFTLPYAIGYLVTAALLSGFNLYSLHLITRKMADKLSTF